MSVTIRYYDSKSNVWMESVEDDKTAADTCRLLQGKQSEAHYVEIDDDGIKREATDEGLEITAVKFDVVEKVP
jgi:hypothetical protein